MSVHDKVGVALAYWDFGQHDKTGCTPGDALGTLRAR